MKMFYEKDTDVNLIKDKKIAIFGYGSHAEHGYGRTNVCFSQL